VLKLAGVAALAASLTFVSACGGGSDDSGSTGTTSSAGATDALGAVNKATGTPIKIGVITRRGRSA